MKISMFCIIRYMTEGELQSYILILKVIRYMTEAYLMKLLIEADRSHMWRTPRLNKTSLIQHLHFPISSGYNKK